MVFPAHQPQHVLVPIQSLTNSPTSSTGSASVLEWNSNSDHESYSLTSINSRPHSPNPARDNVRTHAETPTTTALDDTASTNVGEPLLNQLEPNSAHLIDLFEHLAAIADGAAPTMTEDAMVDEYHTPLSALAERLSLQDSVTQWQNDFYHATSEDDRRQSPSKPRYHLLEEEVGKTTTSPNLSTDTGSNSMTTVTPSLGGSSLLPVPQSAEVASSSTSVADNIDRSQIISIARYFELKAADVEGVTVTGSPAVAASTDATPTDVDVPSRPASAFSSAHSALSYASSEPRVIFNAEDFHRSPSLGVATRISCSTSTSSSSPNPSWYAANPTNQPTISSGKPMDDLLINSFKTDYTSDVDSPPRQPRSFSPYVPPRHSADYLDHPESESVDNMAWSSFRPQEPTSPFPFVRHLEPSTRSPSPTGEWALERDSRDRLPSFYPSTHGARTKRYTASAIPSWHRDPHGYPSGVKTPSRLNAPTGLSNTTISSGNIPSSKKSPGLPESYCQRERFSSCTSNADKTKHHAFSPSPDLSSHPSPPQRPLASSLSPPWSGWGCPLPEPNTPSPPSVPRPAHSRMDISGYPAGSPWLGLQPVSTGEFVYAMDAMIDNAAAAEVNQESFWPAACNAADLNVCTPKAQDNHPRQRNPRRALPIPKPLGAGVFPDYFQRPTPTIARDMKLAPSATPPVYNQPERRLRFAPLPPTPRMVASTLGPYFPNIGPYSSQYLYQTPAPVPPVALPMQPRSFGLPPAPSAFYSPPFIPAVPHPVYWFMDGSITFRVKNTTYRVHRHHFQQHSEYFRSYLETVDSDFTRGPFTPIELSNVQTHEFERLLSIFYPSNLANRGLTTAEEWRSILTLSIRWRFPQLKVLAIRKLGQVLSTVDKIVLAQAHGVLDVHWLLPAYAELCTMDRPVKLEDAEKLGMQTVLKIWQVQHLRSTLGLNEPCDHLVKDEFGLP